MSSVVALSEVRQQRVKRCEAEDRPAWDSVPAPRRCQVTPLPKPEIPDIRGAARIAGHASSGANLGSIALTIALIPIAIGFHLFALSMAVTFSVTTMTRGNDDEKKEGD